MLRLQSHVSFFSENHESSNYTELNLKDSISEKYEVINILLVVKDNNKSFI